jgi:hypothetical protein
MKKHFLGNSLQFLNKENAPGHDYATGRMNFKTAQDLANETAGLSSFTGGMGYIGLGDPFLSFDGKTGSFIDPMDKGKIYNLTLTNGAGATRYALLCPGLLEDAVGLIADGAFNDTTGTAGLTGSGSPQAIAILNAFVKYFPSLIVGMKISTNNIVQIDQQFIISKQSPFKTHATRNINVGAWANEINPNTGLISVQESFYMNNQTIITYPIVATTTVNIALFFGVSLNISNALRAKTQQAMGTVANNPALVAKAQALNFSGRH